MSSDPRVERLSARFTAIQEAMEHVHGKQRAFAAASAAWLMSIENVFVAYLPDEPDRKQHVNALLQSYHKELCRYLHVDQQDSFDLAAHFHQIVKDIVDERG